MKEAVNEKASSFDENKEQPTPFLDSLVLGEVREKRGLKKNSMFSFLFPSFVSGIRSIVDEIVFNLSQWEDRVQKGLFRYDVTACETKVRY